MYVWNFHFSLQEIFPHANSILTVSQIWTDWFRMLPEAVSRSPAARQATRVND